MRRRRRRRKKKKREKTEKTEKQKDRVAKKRQNQVGPSRANAWFRQASFRATIHARSRIIPRSCTFRRYPNNRSYPAGLLGGKGKDEEKEKEKKCSVQNECCSVNFATTFLGFISFRVRLNTTTRGIDFSRTRGLDPTVMMKIKMEMFMTSMSQIPVSTRTRCGGGQNADKKKKKKRIAKPFFTKKVCWID